jgi:hypothetical protein
MEKNIYTYISLICIWLFWFIQNSVATNTWIIYETPENTEYKFNEIKWENFWLWKNSYHKIDNDNIIYVSQWRIYKYNINTKVETILKDKTTNDIRTLIANDTYIFFTRHITSNTYWIYRINIDGTNELDLNIVKSSVINISYIYWDYIYYVFSTKLKRVRIDWVWWEVEISSRSIFWTKPFLMDDNKIYLWSGWNWYMLNHDGSSEVLIDTSISWHWNLYINNNYIYYRQWNILFRKDKNNTNKTLIVDGTYVAWSSSDISYWVYDNNIFYIKFSHWDQRFYFYKSNVDGSNETMLYEFKYNPWYNNIGDSVIINQNYIVFTDYNHNFHYISLNWWGSWILSNWFKARYLHDNIVFWNNINYPNGIFNQELTIDLNNPKWFSFTDKTIKLAPIFLNGYTWGLYIKLEWDYPVWTSVDVKIWNQKLQQVIFILITIHMI